VEKVTKWIPISEGLPERYRPVLIFCNGMIDVAELDEYPLGRHPLWWHAAFTSGYEWETEWQYDDVSHWAELPEGPT
jgi:hypothetical protein